MKGFVIGVIVGAVADRMLVNSGVSNPEVIAELRRTIKKLDDALAEKVSEATDATVEDASTP